MAKLIEAVGRKIRPRLRPGKQVSDEDIIEMLRRVRAGEQRSIVAAEFGVSRKTIWRWERERQ